MVRLLVTSLLGLGLLVATVVLGSANHQDRQILAAPLPEPSDALIEPELQAEGVEWTDRAGGFVGYAWVGQVANDNTIPILATVTLFLHDSEDQVIHSAETELFVGPGEIEGFSEEGRIDEEIALRAHHWSFHVGGSPYQASGEAPTAEKPPVAADVNSDTSRVQDLLRVRKWEADVCLRDVNGNGVEDFLVVHKAGLGEGNGAETQSLEALDESVKGAAKALFALAALDGALEVKRKSQDWQAEFVYLQSFDELYEYQLSEIAHCSGSLEDYDYRMCLMRGFFIKERADAYPTLPSCPQHKAP